MSILKNKQRTFLDIIDTHKGIIYKITNGYCKDQADRQDLTQEIILQLWRSFDKYDVKYSITTWMYRIALNTSISFYRKHKLRIENSTQLLSKHESALAIAEVYTENPDVTQLQGFIQELKEIDKAIILLYLDGLAQKDIAEIIGITSTNVSTRITRIKKNLRQKFQTIKE